MDVSNSRSYWDSGYSRTPAGEEVISFKSVGMRICGKEGSTAKCRMVRLAGAGMGVDVVEARRVVVDAIVVGARL